MLSPGTATGSTLRPGRRHWLLAAVLVVLVGGCSSQRSDSPAQGRPPGTDTAADAAQTLWRPQPASVALTDPLELDQGRLQIPTPEGWDLRRNPEYLLVCHRGNYPRIYVSAEHDAAFTNVTPANVTAYAEAATKRLKDKQLAVPVRPVQVGNFLGVCYGWEATSKGKRLMRFFLVTTRGQRRYTVELRCLEATYDGYRDTALAVVAAMQLREQTPPAAPEKPSEDEPAENGNKSGGEKSAEAAAEKKTPE